MWKDPTTDRSFWERVWCNRLVMAEHKAFDPVAWDSLKKANPVKPGDLITLGFDGAQFDDSTGLVATHVETGFQWVLGAWEKPYGKDDWQIQADEVDDAVSAAFERYKVWRMYADPPYWQSWLAKWAGKYGEDKVMEWWTNRRKQMSYALENFSTAITSKTLSHDGDINLARHIANAHRHDLPQRDEDGKPLWLIRKERSDSPKKIDLAMAAVLSWEARTDAITSGADKKQDAGLFML
ncbi:MAG: terminase, partial [Kiritimatiellae bacterium]|nr:terminase [Kiritimatiellia bacterium]